MKPEQKSEAPSLGELINESQSNPFRWLWLVAALLLIAAGIWFFFIRNSEKSSLEETRFVTEKIRRGDIRLSVTATGNLEPTNEVTIGSELSGITAEVYVDANDEVTVGQELARIDVLGLGQEISRTAAAVSAAEASVKQVEATLKENEASLARLQDLNQRSGGKMPSTADMAAAEAAVLRSEADLGAAKATVEQARATLEANEEKESKAILRSPINGVILSRDVEPGQTVAASFSAPELFVVAEDLKKMKLEVAVAEADIGRVEAEQAATFMVDAWPNREYEAKVKKVSFGSEIIDNVVTYETELEVSNEDLSLRPGMTATAEIQVALHEGVLLVPDAALRFDPSESRSVSDRGSEKSFIDSLIPSRPKSSGGGSRSEPQQQQTEPTIWTLENGKPVAITVTKGLSSGGFTEVTGDGLSENLPVIIRKNVSAQ